MQKREPKTNRNAPNIELALYMTDLANIKELPDSPLLEIAIKAAPITAWELRTLLKEMNLTTQRLAQLLDRSPSTTESWAKLNAGIDVPRDAGLLIKALALSYALTHH